MLASTRFFLAASVGCALVSGAGRAWAESARGHSVARSARETFLLVDGGKRGLQPAELHLAAEQPTLLFLNRAGATIGPGDDDASNNLSSLAETTVQIPAFQGSESAWQEIRECVAQQFFAFNVQVTDVDPQAANHVEVVVGGLASDLNPDIDVAGLSPFTRDCSVIPNAMVYVFAASLAEAEPREICEIVAQEVAHSFGLDHAYLCEDTLTYLDGCGAKSFQPITAPCGEDEPRACANPAIGYDCKRQEQNSVELLAQVLGVRDGDQPPLGRFVGLDEGAVLTPGFEIEVEAEDDDSAISLVELRIDGVPVDVARQAPYLLSGPAQLANGSHRLEAIVHSGAQHDDLAVSIVIEGGEDTALVVGGCASGRRGAPPWFAWLLALALVARGTIARAGSR